MAHGRSEKEIQQLIGADRLIYQDLADLIVAVNKKGKSDQISFDTSVFSGKYITGDVSDQYLEQLELLRNDTAKQTRESSNENTIGLHNNP